MRGVCVYVCVVNVIPLFRVWSGGCSRAEPAVCRGAGVVDKLQCNMSFFPAQGDVDCEPFVASLKARGLDKSETKRYEDQVHGFLAARGDWVQASVKEAADEVVARTIALFEACL